MAKSKTVADTSSNYKEYGVPFYAVGWVPYDHVRSDLDSGEKQHDDPSQSQSEEESATSALQYVVLAGGGGEGRTGVPNAVVISSVDCITNSISDQPIAKLQTGSDLPYRIAVHPRGDGVICAFPKSCRLFNWEVVEGNELHKLGIKASERIHKLGIKASERTLTELEDAGQQMALKFNSEGTILAAGSEDGKLRVFKWPSMETILNEAEAHPSVDDMAFSCDGKYLVTLERKLCRVWDITASKVVTSLQKENDEVFRCCRFSNSSDKDEVLYIAAVTDRGTSVLMWNTTTWKRIKSKRIVRDGVTSFDICGGGKFLAVGTNEGDVLIINAATLGVHDRVRKAHTGMVTALALSHDSRALVSTSFDRTARLTLIKEREKRSGGGILYFAAMLMVLMLAIAVYFLMERRTTIA